MKNDNVDQVVSSPVRIIKLDKSQNLDLTKYEPHQIEKARDLSKSLVTDDNNSILNYGLELQTKLSEYSNDMLSNVRNIDTGEIGSIIQDLLGQLNMVKIEETRNPVMRFIETLPILKNMVNSTKNALVKYDQITGNLDNVVLKVDQARVTILKDINTLDRMFNKSVEYIVDIDNYILAAKMKTDELEQDIAEMEVSDNVEAFEIQDAKNYLDRLKKKTLDLQLTKHVSVQSLPQIRIVQGNNSIMVEKMQSAVTNTIPLWRNHICMAIAIDKQKRIIEIQKNINSTTNEIMLKNSEKLKDNSIEVAKLNEDTIIDIETLKKVNADLISTLDEIMKIKKEGDLKRQSIQKDLELLDKDIKQKVMDTKLLISGNNK